MTYEEHTVEQAIARLRREIARLEEDLAMKRRVLEKLQSQATEARHE